MSAVHNLVRPHYGLGIPGRALPTDVILDILLRITERWPLSSGERNRFAKDVISYASPSDLRAAVTAAIAGGHKDVIDIFFQRTSPLYRWAAGDFLQVLHELLDHGHGSYIRDITFTDSFKELAVSDVLVVVQRLAGAASQPFRFYTGFPQAAHFTKQEVISLVDLAMANDQPDIAERLIELPQMQLLSSQEFYNLLQQAVNHEKHMISRELCRLPGFEQLTVPLLLDLLHKSQFLLGTDRIFNDLLRSLPCLPVETLCQLSEAAMQSDNAELFAALTGISSVLRLPNFGELLDKAVAEGRELAACNLLRLPEARHLPQGMLQGLKELAAEKGQEVVQLGLDYLLHVQQLEASTSSWA